MEISLNLVIISACALVEITAELNPLRAAASLPSKSTPQWGILTCFLIGLDEMKLSAEIALFIDFFKFSLIP